MVRAYLENSERMAMRCEELAEIISKQRAALAEKDKEIAALRKRLEEADALCDAAWEINKNMPLMSEAAWFHVSRENMNRLIQARLNYDNARRKEAPHD